MNLQKLINRLAIFINFLCAVSLLLAYSAAYISPNLFWPIAFFGLALPYFLLINLIFLVYWAFRGSKYFFAILLIIALGYKSIPTLVQLNFDSKILNKNEVGIKVLSFNVRLFDLYMWSNKRETRNKIFDFLKKENPDILCLQEFFYRNQEDSTYSFETLDTLVSFLKAKNYHVENTVTLRNNDHFGIITFSKYPILNKGIVPFQPNSDNICIYTDILYQKDTIRVYNGHLSSIKLDKYDYKAVRGINRSEYSDNFNKGKMILDKLKQSFNKRSYQADSIRHSILQSNYPVILCGDFNDTPTSYAYRQVKGNMIDAFMDSGSGLGQTYIGDFPSFRIDYILFDDVFYSADFKTHPEKLSDHHPISAEIHFKKE